MNQLLFSVFGPKVGLSVCLCAFVVVDDVLLCIIRHRATKSVVLWFRLFLILLVAWYNCTCKIGVQFAGFDDFELSSFFVYRELRLA